MYIKLNAKQQAKAASHRAAVYSIHARLAPSAQSEIRCYQSGGPLFARMTLEYPGNYSLWEFHPADGEEGVFTIKNVGLDRFVVADTDGALIVAFSDDAAPAEFRVQPAGDGFVQLKQSNADRVWGLRGSALYGAVVLQTADGSFTQKFKQVQTSND